jgi:hypothetical protein
MKLKTLLSVALVFCSASAFAQNWVYDSVALGTGYANDIFYGLDLGNTTLHAGNDWDLAFQIPAVSGRDMTFNAAVRPNHVKRGIEVYLLRDSASVKWSAITPADTVGKTAASLQLINNDTSWGTSAFYQNHNAADPFSYGWGSYSLNDHSITGDLIYLIKVNGAAYKVWIQKYVSQVVAATDTIGYTFRIAKLDGSNDNAVRIKVQYGYADRLLAYYNIDSNMVFNREPVRSSWDILFTQYRQLINAGPSGMIPYNLTGVLTNLGTEVADVRHVNPDDINATNFKTYINNTATTTHTSHTDEIGADWKTYVNPGPNGYYQLDDSASYIVKTKYTVNYWQFQFIRFDGGGATGMGKILFRKRLLGTAVGVPAVAAQSLNAFTVSPNPAGTDATLLLDSKKAASAQMLITDMAGRVLQTATLDLKTGINAYSLSTANWPAGVYAVQVAAQDWKVSTSLAVSH